MKAVEEWKVDVVVLQGSESGGHGAVVCIFIYSFSLLYIFILKLSSAYHLVIYFYVLFV